MGTFMFSVGEKNLLHSHAAVKKKTKQNNTKNKKQTLRSKYCREKEIVVSYMLQSLSRVEVSTYSRDIGMN